MASKPKAVFFCGENPGMALYDPENDHRLVVVSYWLCRYSPAGHGQVLVFWHEQDWGMTADSVAGIYSDNQALARLLVETLTQYFPEFEGLDVLSLPFNEADIQQRQDEQQSYQVDCQSQRVDIQLSWSGMLDQRLVVWPNFPIRPQAYDLTTVICPCAQASVTLNGERLALHPQISSVNGLASSSAFLAFAESWVGPI